MFVLDCSVTMAWCFDDESGEYSDRMLDLLETQSALVPRLWHLEVQNVLLVGERRRRIEAPESDRFIELLQTLDIQTDKTLSGIESSDMLALARKYQLSSYDSAYLSLAIREQLPLATQDKRLRDVAQLLGLYKA